FYGRSFTQVNVSTNGFLSFTNHAAPRGGGGRLPEPVGPENLIAPLWSDLDFAETRLAAAWSDGERFIVQYTGVGTKDDPEAGLTFEVILHRSGRIVFQSLFVPAPPSSVTIGIQNADQTIGLLVSGSPSYLHDGLAVEIVRTQWLSADPMSGRVAADGGQDIGL